MSDHGCVTLDEVFAAAAGRAASLVPEISGYLTLAVGDAASRLPFAIDERAVLLNTEGTVTLNRRGEVVAPAVAARSFRDVLARLLAVSTGSMPGLSLAARPRTESDRGLDAVIAEIEAALIPVNRAAARRALGRLARETLRAKDQGRLRARPRPAPRPEAPAPPPPARRVEPPAPPTPAPPPRAATPAPRAAVTIAATAWPVGQRSLMLEATTPPPRRAEPDDEPEVEHEPTPTVLGMAAVVLDEPAAEPREPEPPAAQADPVAPAPAAALTPMPSRPKSVTPPPVAEPALVAPAVAEPELVEPPPAAAVESCAAEPDPEIEVEILAEPVAHEPEPEIVEALAAEPVAPEPVASEPLPEIVEALAAEPVASEPEPLVAQPEPPAEMPPAEAAPEPSAPPSAPTSSAGPDREPRYVLDLIKRAEAARRAAPGPRTPVYAPCPDPSGPTRADDLLERFAAAQSDEAGMNEAARSLRRFAGLEPTPPPPAGIAYVPPPAPALEDPPEHDAEALAPLIAAEAVAARSPLPAVAEPKRSRWMLGLWLMVLTLGSTAGALNRFRPDVLTQITDGAQRIYATARAQIAPAARPSRATPADAPASPAPPREHHGTRAERGATQRAR